MSSDEQNISPEEKLLKVIKGETPAEPAKASPAPAAKVAPPPAVVPQAPRPAAVAASVAVPAPVKPPVPAAQPAPRPVAPPPKLQPAAAAGQVPQPPSALPKPPAAVPKAPAQAATAEKPKLKVAKTDAPAGKTAAKDEPVTAAVPPAPAPAISTPPVSAKKRTEERKFGVRRINYGLAAAVFVLLAFSVNEILAKVKSDSSLHKSLISKGNNDPTPPVQGTTGSELPSLEVIMQWLGDRPIVAKADQKLPVEPPGGGGGGGGGPVQVADWMKYVQDNIKLMGFSGDSVSSWQEAILQETKDGKLIYVKAGGKISIPGQDIQVEAVKDEQVFLTDGRRKMTLK